MMSYDDIRRQVDENRFVIPISDDFTIYCERLHLPMISIRGHMYDALKAAKKLGFTEITKGIQRTGRRETGCNSVVIKPRLPEYFPRPHEEASAFSSMILVPEQKNGDVWQIELLSTGGYAGHAYSVYQRAQGVNPRHVKEFFNRISLDKLLNRDI